MFDAPTWYVISPKFDYTEWVCEYGGPTYEISDVVEVQAWSRDEAIVKGVSRMNEWPSIARGDDKNPFSGVKADILCPECSDHYEHSNYMWSCLVCGTTNMGLEIWAEMNGAVDPSWYLNDWIETHRFTKRQRTRRILKYAREHYGTTE